MPEEAPSNRRSIIILAAILVAVVAASLAVVFLLPSANPLTPADNLADTQETPPSTATGTFNTSVLQRSDYTALNVGLIESKQLPVQPLSVSGKANPFL